MLNLEEITAACEAATPGIWDDKVTAVYRNGTAIRICGDFYSFKSDAYFIANARQWVPELVAEVKQLRAERDAAKKDIEDAMTCMDIPMACNWCKHKNNCKAACGPEWVGLEVQNGQD